MAGMANRPITFTRGDTYEHDVTVTGVDVSAWTFTAQIRRSPDDRTILATFTVSMASAATGDVVLSLTPTQTKVLPVAAVWDVQVVNTAGTFTLFGGTVTVERDTTR